MLGKDNKHGVGPDHLIHVRLPRCQYDLDARPAEPGHRDFLPGGTKLCSVTVRLHEGAKVDIRRYGVPYMNAQAPDLEGIVNEDKPFHRGFSLLDIFARRRVFNFVVNAYPIAVSRSVYIPDAPTYPYGTDHAWDVAKFNRILMQAKGNTQFGQVHEYDDTNSFIAVGTQFNVQDVLWLDNAARAIANKTWAAYFVPAQGGGPDSFYVIVLTSETFRQTYDAAWRRLARGESVDLLVKDTRDGASRGPDFKLYVVFQAVVWYLANTCLLSACQILDHPEVYSALKRHETKAHELILRTKLPPNRPKWLLHPATFPSRWIANVELKERHR